VLNTKRRANVENNNPNSTGIEQYVLKHTAENGKDTSRVLDVGGYD
jgi:hypothetical protein